MKLQHDIQKVGEDIAHAVKKAGDTIKDAASEAAHRVTAETEKHKRETLGDALTPGEKTKSLLNETKNNVQANVDATKRKMDEK